MQVTDVQREEMRMSINLAYVEGTSENLWHILRSHKVRSTFSTGSALCKLVCKPKDRVPTKNKKTISFLKLTLVTAKQSTSVNLSGL